MAVNLVRNAVQEKAGGLANYAKHHPNPGLVLRRGMGQWDAGAAGGAGQKKEDIIALVTSIPASDGYCWAFQRWCVATTDEQQFAVCDLALVGRLYIGVSRDNPLESGVTVGHAWGMPLVPGSALKGVARAAARAAGMDTEAETYLFGTDTRESSAHDEGEAGVVVFHDAWWIPAEKAKPFALERITPHHPEYYAGAKADATDFDSPVPTSQIAVQGAFRFVVEGPDGWRELGLGMLTRALTLSGVGGKTTSGYGLFKPLAN